MNKIRVRFAPSPTGPLHIGGARSALFNYLFAKKNGGDFIVRVEDTDRERSTPISEENIKDSLHWLGIDWNEGIDIGGPFAPYRQMERLATYSKAAEELLAKGYAYYCYCSEEEIEAQRQELTAKGQTPRYLGNCRNLTEQQKEAFVKEGRQPVIRFRVPEDEDLVIEDGVRGKVVFNTAEIGGDFVIVKSDGIPTYNFAVVCDDYLMEISDVIRGEEHLSNTPRQLLLYHALGWQPPKFSHISLILGEDRSKMSKRHGSVSVVNYQNDGYLPEALVNFLALLGWSPEGEEEIFSLAELEEAFSMERVSKSPAVFDINKLRWVNSQYLHQLSEEEIAQGISAYLDENWTEENTLLLAQTLVNHLETFSDVKKFLPLVEGSQMPQWTDECRELMSQEHVPDLIRLFIDKVQALEVWDAAAIKKAIKTAGKELSVKGAGLFMPLRIAITGCQHGPDIDKLAALMGKDLLLARLNSFFEIK
ncbi:MAG: glutamate--tRNA ligase [Clostridiales bacterium]